MHIAEERILHVKQKLMSLGFNNAPSVTVFPDDPNAAPVVVISSPGIYPFDDEKNVRTKTKTYYSPTGKKHLLNSATAVMMEMLADDVRVIAHVEPDKVDEFTSLINLHPKKHLVTVFADTVHADSFIHSLYRALHEISQQQAISRIDICLYTSYSIGDRDPFFTIFEENTADCEKIAKCQFEFYQTFGRIAFDILANRGQKHMTVCAITSLASRRMLAHLYSDAVHKTLASIYLQGLAYETPYYTGKEISVVEIMPGMVDTGTYDPLSTRVAICEARRMDGFPFDKEVTPDNIDVWPMMSVKDLGKIAALYLRQGDHHDELNSYLSQYTYAGRDMASIKKLMRDSVQIDNNVISVKRELPDFCFCPGSTIGQLPKMRNGYIPVFLSPKGQYF